MPCGRVPHTPLFLSTVYRWLSLAVQMPEKGREMEAGLGMQILPALGHGERVKQMNLSADTTQCNSLV